MFLSEFYDILEDQRLHRLLFLILIGIYVYNELRSWWHRSGKYYKPWGSTTPAFILFTKKQIAELSEATCLSQRAAYADMFGFKHTMNKLEHNPSNHKVIRTRLYSRLLQVNGPVHLAALYPHLLDQFDSSLAKEFQNGRILDGGISLPIAETARRLVSKLMSLMFFGDSLSSDEEFSSGLLRYPQDMVKCMAAFQVAPSFMSPIIHALLTNRGKAMHLIQRKFAYCIGPEGSSQNDSDQIQRFAASHQLWMNLHFNTLHQETEQHVPLDYQDLEQLPLLDGFIKETVRCNPLDTLAIRRKALEPYTFSDGSLSVPSGATICVSAHDLMHNPQTYTEPNTFNPTRYLPKKPNSQQRKFTEVSETPGRFHASLAIQIVISQLLLKYDLSLENEKARTKWTWETFTMPYKSSKIILKDRSL
ncbi:cytochrome P450 [Daldinia bambusicola]|nr:cytochrome P450 [Daldinia bambusicola]